MSERLGPEERITRRADFRRVHEHGTRVPGRFMTLYVLPNALAVSRLGIIATRRLGGAVSRNKARRVVREVFRRHKPVAGLDVVILTRPELLSARWTDVVADYVSALRRRDRRVS